MIDDDRILAAAFRVAARAAAIEDDRELIELDDALLLFTGMDVDGRELQKVLVVSSREVYALMLTHPAGALTMLFSGLLRAFLLGWELGADRGES